MGGWLFYMSGMNTRRVIFVLRAKNRGGCFLSPEERMKGVVVFIRRGTNTGVGEVAFAMIGKNQWGWF